ncbi:MAG: glycosyltransferase [Bacillota bacterium]|nr:glycosyltransferase [Bacillota bacterium]
MATPSSPLRRFARFTVVGVGNTLVDFLLFNLLLHTAMLLGWGGSRPGSVPAPLAAGLNAVSFGVALLNSYLWNRSWTWRGSRASFPRFVLVSLASAGASTLVLALWMALWPKPPNVSWLTWLLLHRAAPPISGVLWINAGKAMGGAVSLVTNYVGYSLFSFQRVYRLEPLGGGVGVPVPVGDPARAGEGECAPELSLVIPAYNEAQRLPATLGRIADWVAAWERDRGWRPEVVVVDDGSSDATPELLARFAARHPWLRAYRLEPHGGKGAAVRAGLGAAGGRYAVMSDADLAFGLEPVGQVLGVLREGADVVAGRRLGEGSGLRAVGHRLFQWAIRRLGLDTVADTQCGFKGFRMQRVRRLLAHLHVDNFSFDLELLFVARRNGLRIVEVPLRWRQVEASTVRPGRDAARMLLSAMGIWARGKWGHAYNAEGAGRESTRA